MDTGGTPVLRSWRGETLSHVQNDQRLWAQSSGCLGGEGEDDVFYFGQGLAGLEVAPYFPVPVGEESSVERPANTSGTVESCAGEK